MRAITQDRYGGPHVLHLRDVPRPTPTADQVLVRVHAAGVDRGVVHLMTGLPYPTRAMFGLRRPRQPIPGLDLSGVVEAVGPDVTRFAPGDAVFGTGQGTFAEHALAPESTLTHRPVGVDATSAAALAVSGSTALQAVDDHARIEPGMRVLVLGASGGVGTYAVQVAAARGAIVTGVASTAKLDLVAGLGATEVVDHTTTDPLATTDPYDAILDLGGNHGLRRLRRALTPEGTLVIVGGEGGGRLIGGLDRQLRAVLWSRLVSQHLTTFVASEDHVHLERLAGLVVDGHVRPVVDRTFPLEDAPAAIDHLITGRARGKVVVTVATADREVGALLPPRA